MIVTERERERGRDIGRGRSRLHAPGAQRGIRFDPGSPGSRPGPKAGAKPLRHPGIPLNCKYYVKLYRWLIFFLINSRFRNKNNCSYEAQREEAI